MATIKTQKTEEEEIQVTPDYCYSKAAEILSGRGMYGPQETTAVAAEWRLLGDSLRVSGSKD